MLWNIELCDVKPIFCLSCQLTYLCRKGLGIIELAPRTHIYTFTDYEILTEPLPPVLHCLFMDRYVEDSLVNTLVHPELEERGS